MTVIQIKIYYIQKYYNVNLYFPNLTMVLSHIVNCMFIMNCSFTLSPTGRATVQGKCIDTGQMYII